ncbi:MAG: hypothetical protein E6G66_13170, partial [Actinobacteria bacterium]
VGGLDGLAGVAVAETEAVGVGVAVSLGVAVGVGVGVDVGPGVRWVHAPIAISSTTTPVQAVARRRSAMQQVPPAVDDPVPDELVVLGDAGGCHQYLQALLEVGPGLLEPRCGEVELAEVDGHGPPGEVVVATGQVRGHQVGDPSLVGPRRLGCPSELPGHVTGALEGPAPLAALARGFGDDLVEETNGLPVALQGGAPAREAPLKVAEAAQLDRLPERRPCPVRAPVGAPWRSGHLVERGQRRVERD